MTNWKTTLAGLLGALAMAAANYTGPNTWQGYLACLAPAIIGYLAKDFDNHSTAQQVQTATDKAASGGPAVPTIAKILILVALLGASSASAQNAKVIVLSAEDANKAAALYAQRDAIQKQINELEKALKAKHLTVNGQPKDGWASGFQFSEDFKAIVPAQATWTSLTSSTPIVAPFTPSCWNVSPSSTLCGGSGCPYSAPMYGPVYGINNNPIGISTIN